MASNTRLSADYIDEPPERVGAHLLLRRDHAKRIKADAQRFGKLPSEVLEGMLDQLEDLLRERSAARGSSKASAR
jgi:hypothetical protein